MFEELDLESLYPDQGQWGVHPRRALALLLLQAFEGLTDQQAAEQTEINIGWKYNLFEHIDFDGYDDSLFSRIRLRFEQMEDLQQLLDAQLKIWREKGLLNTSKQRVDSTMILARARMLSRLELIFDSVRHAIEELTEVDQEWLLSVAQSHWLERYYKDRPFNYRFPKSDAAREELAKGAREDGEHILAVIEKAEKAKRDQFEALESIVTLKRVLEEHFNPPGSKNAGKLKDKKTLKPSAERIHTPYEPDAKVAKKNGVISFGYKVHSTETCVDDSPNLITDIRTEPATRSDALALEPIVEDLVRRDLKPEKLLFDGGYINYSALTRLSKLHGIKALTRVLDGKSWQSRENKGFSNIEFHVDWGKEVVTCPAAIKSNRWKTKADGDIEVYFPKESCGSCKFKTSCTTAKQRIIRLKSREVWETIRDLNEYHNTDEARREYSLRAGAEGTQSQLIGVAGRRSRVYGLKKTSLRLMLAGLVVNFCRILSWEKTKKKRKSPQGRYERALAPVSA